jgi:hypothetical protein
MSMDVWHIWKLRNVHSVLMQTLEVHKIPSWLPLWSQRAVLRLKRTLSLTIAWKLSSWIRHASCAGTIIWQQLCFMCGAVKYRLSILTLHSTLHSQMLHYWNSNLYRFYFMDSILTACYDWPLTVTLCSPVPGCVKRSTWMDTSPTLPSSRLRISEIQSQV